MEPFDLPGIVSSEKVTWKVYIGEELEKTDAKMLYKLIKYLNFEFTYYFIKNFMLYGM